MMKEKRFAQLLAQVRKTKEKQRDKGFVKIVGKKKNQAEFDKVNFNG